MLLQPDSSDFIISVIKDVDAHEAIYHWTLMKNREVKNKHKNKDGKINTVLSIWYFERKILTDGILMKHKCRLCAHGGMQQWVVN